TSRRHHAKPQVAILSVGKSLDRIRPITEVELRQAIVNMPVHCSIIGSGTRDKTFQLAQPTPVCFNPAHA
ncbi:MAG: hypothetical protein ACQEUH_01335, partial [Pseudomonadota bacterium]